jgi:hypothetical protein
MMRLARRASLLVALSLLTSAATASDAQPSQAYRTTIADCVVMVRKEAYNRSFDMYLTRTNRSRGWGSDHEINKCMEELGYDVQVVPVPKEK